MITSDEAERIATEVIGPAAAGDGQGWHLEEFDSGWFIREDWMSEKSIRRGSFSSSSGQPGGCWPSRQASRQPASRPNTRRSSIALLRYLADSPTFPR